MNRILFIVAQRWENWGEPQHFETCRQVAPYAPDESGCYGPEPYGPDPYGIDPYGPDPYAPAGDSSDFHICANAEKRTPERIPLSSGLRNSVNFQVEMLGSLGIEALMAEVPSPHCIDEIVRSVRPTHVIVEAIWVMPQKFDELRALHPHVRWIVRNHSPTPFLAGEFSAFSFIGGYLARGIEVMANDPRSVEDLRAMAHARGVSEHLVTYGPNFYPTPAFSALEPRFNHDGLAVDVALFGAVRPLKNHLVQAIAAMHFADLAGLQLRLHVNGSRVEMQASSQMNNLRNLFAGSKHVLVEHGWAPHEKFCELLRRMNFCLQCNQSESYNVVSADAASVGVPIVVSNEVPWVGSYAWADPARSRSISKKMWEIWREPLGEQRARLHAQRRDMAAFNQRTETIWAERFAAWKQETRNG